MADVDEETLSEAIRAALVEKPGMGVKPLVKHITATHGWNCDSKAVRDAMAAIACSKYVPAGRAGEAAMARAEQSTATKAAAAAAAAAKGPVAPTSTAHNQLLKDIIS